MKVRVLLISLALSMTLSLVCPVMGDAPVDDSNAADISAGEAQPPESADDTGKSVGGDKSYPYSTGKGKDFGKHESHAGGAHGGGFDKGGKAGEGGVGSEGGVGGEGGEGGFHRKGKSQGGYGGGYGLPGGAYKHKDSEDNGPYMVFPLFKRQVSDPSEANYVHHERRGFGKGGYGGYGGFDDFGGYGDFGKGGAYPYGGGYGGFDDFGGYGGFGKGGAYPYGGGYGGGFYPVGGIGYGRRPVFAANRALRKRIRHCKHFAYRNRFNRKFAKKNRVFYA